MTKQKEIREDAIVITKNQLYAEGIRDEQRLAVRAIQIVDQIFGRLSEKGVVIKVKCPDCEWSQFGDEAVGMTPCSRCNSTGHILESIIEEII